MSEVFYDDLCLLQNYNLTIGTTSRAWEAHFVVVSSYSKSYGLLLVVVP